MWKRIAVSMLAAGVLMVAWEPLLAQAPQQQAPEPPKPRQAPKLTLMETIKRYLPRVGATVDESKSTVDMVVSNYPDPKGGKVTIVMLNERRKSLLGFYVYNFGNLKNVRDREEVYRYLLASNHAITIGSFFVDGDQDVGYKYLLSTEQPLSLAVFQSIYLTMAAVARERRAEIARLLEPQANK